LKSDKKNIKDKEHENFAAVYSSVIRQYLKEGESVINEYGKDELNKHFAFVVHL